MKTQIGMLLACAGLLIGCADEPGESLDPPEKKAEKADSDKKVDSTAQEKVTQPSAGDKKDEKTDTDSKSETFTHKVTEIAEYYKGGPQQAQPPDGKFQPGTKVNIVQDAGSYSLVTSEGGIEA